MIDCLQNDSFSPEVVFNSDGTVKTGYGCLSATVQKFMLGDHVEYDIQLKHPNGHTWCVTRRYREFWALRKALEAKYSLPDELIAALPGKKLFKNLSPVFVQQRSLELEAFLNGLLSYYTLPPPPLAGFIDWERYDIHGITNRLARQLARDGESLLDSGDSFVLNVYQLSAINKRMASPVTVNLFNNVDEDFSNVVNFISRLERLKLFGSLDKVHKSNVAVNALNFDMSPFRNLQYLELYNVDLARMRGFEHIKASVTQLVVHHSLKNLKNLMLGDLFAAGDGDWVYGDNPVSTLPWDQIKIADFSNNYLYLIDQTITLLPNVEILNLSNNLLTELASLSSLPRLRVLYLADNQLYIGEESNPPTTEVVFEDDVGVPEAVVLASMSGGTADSTAERRSRHSPLPPLRERLGEVQILVLANNGLRSADIVEGLLSLQHLDLSDNKIESFEALACLRELPQLNSVELCGNPICDHPYYRRNVMDILGPRFPLIVLDGQRVTAKECEIVRLYQALMRGGILQPVSPYSGPVCSLQKNIEDGQIEPTNERDPSAFGVPQELRVIKRFDEPGMIDPSILPEVTSNPSFLLENREKNIGPGQNACPVVQSRSDHDLSSSRMPHESVAVERNGFFLTFGTEALNTSELTSRLRSTPFAHLPERSSPVLADNSIPGLSIQDSKNPNVVESGVTEASEPAKAPGHQLELESREPSFATIDSNCDSELQCNAADCSSSDYQGLTGNTSSALQGFLHTHVKPFDLTASEKQKKAVLEESKTPVDESTDAVKTPVNRFCSPQKAHEKPALKQHSSTLSVSSNRNVDVPIEESNVNKCLLLEP